MNLDPRRSAIINSARLLSDAGANMDQVESITIGLLASLGLRSVSPGKWEIARTAFDILAAQTDEFDAFEELLGPWKSNVETGEVSPVWCDVLRQLAAELNKTLDYLIEFADKHGRPFEEAFTPDDVEFFDSISRVLKARVRS